MTDELIKELEEAVSNFIDGLSPIENKIYRSVITMLKELSLDSAGNIKNNLTNIKILGKVRREMNDIIFSDKYKKDVVGFTDSFTKVAAIQDSYFSTLVNDFSAPKLTTAIREQAIATTIEGLTEQGINGNVISQLKDIIKTNITGGGSYADFTEQVKTFIEGDADTSGVLTRYARTYVTDSLNEYSANHIRIVSDDLGLVWYRYAGSLMKTSRDFCIQLVAQDYVHVSQFPDLLKGHVNGKTVPLYSKTGLPEGMKANTNVTNFQDLRGGWGCNHQLIPVITENVPQKYRDAIGG